MQKASQRHHIKGKQGCWPSCRADSARSVSCCTPATSPPTTSSRRPRRSARRSHTARTSASARHQRRGQRNTVSTMLYTGQHQSAQAQQGKGRQPDRHPGASRWCEMSLFLPPARCCARPPSPALTINAVHVCHVGNAHQAPHHHCTHEPHAIRPQLREEGLLGCLQGRGTLHTGQCGMGRREGVGSAPTAAAIHPFNCSSAQPLMLVPATGAAHLSG